MKTFSAVMVLVAILLVPGTAAAKSKDPDKRAAIAQCKSERGKSKASRHAFKAKYHSFSRCSHKKVAKVKAAKAARRAATSACTGERDDDAFPDTHADQSFDQYYDSADKGQGGFNDCVSTKVDEQDGDNNDGDDNDGEHADEVGGDGDNVDGQHADDQEHHQGGDETSNDD